MVNFDLGVFDYQGTLASAVTMLEYAGLVASTTETADADGSFTWYDNGSTGDGGSGSDAAYSGTGGAGDGRTAWRKVFQCKLDGPDVPTELTASDSNGVHLYTHKDCWLTGADGCYDSAGTTKFSFSPMNDIHVAGTTTSNARAGYTTGEDSNAKASGDTSLAQDMLRSIANEVQGGLATGDPEGNGKTEAQSKGLSDILVGETQILTDLTSTINTALVTAWTSTLTAAEALTGGNDQGSSNTKAEYEDGDNLCARIFDSLFYSAESSGSFRNRLVKDLMERPSTEAGEQEIVSLFKAGDTITFHIQIQPNTATAGDITAASTQTVTIAENSEDNPGADAEDLTYSDKTISSRLYKITVTLAEGGQ